jgi:hypothetical protein
VKIPQISKLKKKADKIFSELVRRSSANSLGMAVCCSCGKQDFWKDMDAGHYISRKHNAGRYLRENVASQCRSCNRFNEGNKSGYTLFLQNKYGEDIIERLNQLQYQVKHFEVDELQGMIKGWQEELKGLKNV